MFLCMLYIHVIAALKKNVHIDLFRCFRYTSSELKDGFALNKLHFTLPTSFSLQYPLILIPPITNKIHNRNFQ